MVNSYFEARYLDTSISTTCPPEESMTPFRLKIGCGAELLKNLSPAGIIEAVRLLFIWDMSMA